MIRFLSFSFLVLTLSSCGSLPDMEGFQEIPTEKAAMAYNPYFSETHKAHLYKAQITVYGKELSGIFAIKRMKDTLWRAALMSEFGSTLLDISFNESYSEVNYSIKQFDKKFIISTLIEDFRLLVLPKRKVIKKYEIEDRIVLKTKGRNGFVYAYFEKKPHRLIKLTRTNARKKKASVYFSNFKEEQPKTIKIAHHNLRLEMILNAIPQTHAD